VAHAPDIHLNVYLAFPETVELAVGVKTLTPLVGEVIATSIVPVVGVGVGVE
jgi:hypothetical protein